MTYGQSLGNMSPQQMMRELNQTEQRIKLTQPRQPDLYLNAVKLLAWLARTQLAFGHQPGLDECRAKSEEMLALLKTNGYPGHAHWMRGYFHVQVQEYEQARACFQDAQPHMRRVPDYWLDRGRAEYNTGHLQPALKAFEQAYTLANRMSGRVDEQHYRWLAKTHRWLGQHAAEAKILQAAIHAAGKRPLEQATQNIVTERFARALLLARDFTGVITAVDDMYARVSPSQQAELAAIKTAALCALDQEDDAAAYAQDTARALGAPGDKILAALLTHTRRPASATRALREALLNTPEEAALAFTTDPRTGRGQASSVPSDADAAFARVYRAATRAKAAGHADLTRRFLFDAAELALSQNAPLALAHTLCLLNTVTDTSPETGDLYEEAAEQYPHNGLLLLHAGHHHLISDRPQQALDLLERAANISEELEVVAAPLAAQAYGALGDQDEALRRFRTLIEREWADQPREVIGTGVFTPAVQWAQRSGHLLWGVQWADQWMRHTHGVLTQQESLPIHQAAGQCALALGEYEAAYQYFTSTQAVYGAWLKESQQAQLRLRDMARNSALLALAAVLTGRVDEAHTWIETAQAQANDLDVLPLVNALLQAREGNVDLASATMGAEPRTSLWIQVARLIARDCDAANRADLAEALRREADRTAGEGPSLEDTLQQLGEQAARLIEARREAAEHQRYRAAARDVFEALVERTGLLPQDHAAYAALRDAALDGQSFDPDVIAEAVLAQLTERLNGLQVRGDACVALMDDAAWTALPAYVRELLTLAQNHLAYAQAQHQKDHGPALLYLAKILEELLGQEVAAPLEERVGTQRVPWRDFSLGCVPKRLLGHGRDVSMEYASAVHEVTTRLPTETRTYLRGRWREDAHALVNARNAWAHRRDAVTPETMSALLPRIVGAPGTPTLLGAGLALADACT